MRAGLACVEKDQRADGPGSRAHGRDRGNRTGHVGYVGECDQPRIWRDDGESLRVDTSVGRQIEPRELCTRAFTQLLPRDDIRVVLGAGADDAVSRSDAQAGRLRASHPLRRVCDGQRNEVDRLGRILRPYDLVGRNAHERGQGPPSALKRVGRFVAEEVRTPVNRAVAVAVELGLSVDDAGRLLRGRRRVEVRDGRAAAPEATQNRKIDANRLELGGGEIRGHRDQRPRYLS